MSVTDITILMFLKKMNAVDSMSGYTIYDFPLDDLMLKSNSLYKRIKRLQNAGYVAVGFRDEHAHTYYITENGLKIVEREESL